MLSEERIHLFHCYSWVQLGGPCEVTSVAKWHFPAPLLANLAFPEILARCCPRNHTHVLSRMFWALFWWLAQFVGSSHHLRVRSIVLPVWHIFESRTWQRWLLSSENYTLAHVYMSAIIGRGFIEREWM